MSVCASGCVGCLIAGAQRRRSSCYAHALNEMNWCRACWVMRIVILLSSRWRRKRDRLEIASFSFRVIFKAHSLAARRAVKQSKRMTGLLCWFWWFSSNASPTAVASLSSHVFVIHDISTSSSVIKDKWRGCHLFA